MDEPTLRDQLAVLRRRRRVVIVCALAGLAIALVVSLLQTPLYSAETELLLRQSQSEQLLIDDVGQVRSSANSERELNNEIRMIESTAIRDAVDDAYDGPLDVDIVQGRAEASDANDVIVISALSPRPAQAADLVNTYAETYIAARQEEQVNDLLATSEEIQTRLDTLQGRIAEVRKPLDDVEAELAATPESSDSRADLEAERNRISAEVLPQLAPLLSRDSRFRGQLEQLEVTEDLARSGGLEVITEAEPPSSPASPNTPANLAVGTLVGLLAGVFLAFALEHVDDSIRSKEDMERATDLPVLGLIPKAPDGNRSVDLVSAQDPTSAAAEAYRSLRTSVKFLRLEQTMGTIVVTSASASEGKTVTAVNLATVLAQSGDRVILVSADLRRPRAHDALGAPVSPGLTTVLLGETSAESATYAVEEVPGLHFMAPGPPPPNPAELLESNAARDLFRALAESYDSVIIDSPPVLPVTDPQVLASMVDAVLVVVGYHRTSRRGLKRAIELMAQVHAPLVGTVFNLVPASEGYGGEPYGYDTYRSRAERRRARKRHQEETTQAPATTLRPVAPAADGPQAPAAAPDEPGGETTPGPNGWLSGRRPF